MANRSPRMESADEKAGSNDRALRDCQISPYHRDVKAYGTNFSNAAQDHQVPQSTPRDDDLTQPVSYSEDFFPADRLPYYNLPREFTHGSASDNHASLPELKAADIDGHDKEVFIKIEPPSEIGEEQGREQEQEKQPRPQPQPQPQQEAKLNVPSKGVKRKTGLVDCVLAAMEGRHDECAVCASKDEAQKRRRTHHAEVLELVRLGMGRYSNIPPQKNVLR